MSDAYEKMMKRAALGRIKPQKNLKRKRVSEDSFNSSERDIPNIFGSSSRDPYEERIVQHPSGPTHKNTTNNNQNNNEVELVDDEQLPQGYVEQEKAPLSLMQSIGYFMGVHTTDNSYPKKQTIYIDCNDPAKPELKSPTDNNLRVSAFFIAIALLFRHLLRPYIIVWLAICILAFVIDSSFRSFSLSMYPAIITGLLIAAVLLNAIVEHLMIRKRRVWEESLTKYRVYHHFGESAEWVATDSSDLRAGQLYKISFGDFFPADSIMLHSKQSLVPIQVNRIMPTLTYHPTTTMKETVIKAGIIILPIEGHLQTEQTTTQFSSFTGQLYLSSPVQIKHNVGLSNLVLRGYRNTSPSQVLCMVVSTGVENYSLRQAQFPMSYSTNANHLTLSDYGDRLTLILIVVYLILVAVTVLGGYIYSQAITKPYYISSSNLQFWKVIIHCLVNYIIFVPILLRPVSVIFVYIQGLLVGRAFKISQDVKMQIRDYTCLDKISHIDTVLTSIDCLRNPHGFSMHSFKVKEIHHIFDGQSPLQNQQYGVEDVDLIKYFMSVALLTTHTEDNQPDVTGFEKAIRLASQQCGVRMEFNHHDNCTIVNNQQFRVSRLLKIPMTYQRPYCMVFYKPISKNREADDEAKDDRVLCLIRGEPQLLLHKVYGKEVQMSKWSQKLVQEKGYRTQLIGKLVLSINDLEEIERAFKSGNMQLTTLTQGLERYIGRMQSMGLLIFNNQFSSNKLTSQILNVPSRKQSRVYKPGSLGVPQRNLVIISPASDSNQAPEFQSIHTLTNLLQQAFHLPLSQISSKLIHDQIITSQSLIKKLHQQRILVLNGWNKKDLEDMIGDLTDIKAVKKNEDSANFASVSFMSYFQKDQYAFIMRKCQVNIAKGGWDIEKYADLVLLDHSQPNIILQNPIQQQTNKHINLTPIALERLLSYDCPILNSNLQRIILNQLFKCILIITVQVIGSFYTWGTGLLTIPPSQYLLIEIICFIDIFYYLNFSHQKIPPPRQLSFVGLALLESLIGICQAVFFTLVTIYSLQSITVSTGTLRGKEFVSSIIVFALIHLLIFRKLFLTPVLSFYKLLWIIIQIGVYYIGMVVISAVDTVTSATYAVQNILWYLLQGRLILCGIGCVCVCLTVEFVKVIMRSLFAKGYSNYYRKLQQGNRYKNSKRVNYDVRLEVID